MVMDGTFISQPTSYVVLMLLIITKVNTLETCPDLFASLYDTQNLVDDAFSTSSIRSLQYVDNIHLRFYEPKS